MTTLRMIPGITYTRKNLEALTGMPDRENRRMIREQRRQGVPSLVYALCQAVRLLLMDKIKEGRK